MKHMLISIGLIGALWGSAARADEGPGFFVIEWDRDVIPPRARDALTNNPLWDSTPADEELINVGVPVALSINAGDATTVEDILWTIDLSVIKAYSIDSDVTANTGGFLTECSTTEISASDLEQEQINYYYTEVGTSDVSVSALVDGKRMTDTITFDVQRHPKAEIFYATGDGQSVDDTPDTDPDNVLGQHHWWHQEIASVLSTDDIDFLLFHRGFIHKFDCWRAMFDYPCVKVYLPGTLATGEGYVPTGDEFDHLGFPCGDSDCSDEDGSGTGIVDRERPEPDTDHPILPLPPTFTLVGDGSWCLGDYATASDASTELESGIHLNVHFNACHDGDFVNPLRTPADPIFWRFHLMLTKVHELWQLLQLHRTTITVTDTDCSGTENVYYPDEDLAFYLDNVSCADGIDDPCDPPSGYPFGIGTTTVNCIAKDVLLLDPEADPDVVGYGRTTCVTFDVTVNACSLTGGSAETLISESSRWIENRGVEDCNGNGAPDDEDIQQQNFGFIPAQGVLVGLTPNALATHDFNMDGHLDLAVTKAIPDRVAVLDGLGNGLFLPAADYPVGNVPVSVAAGLVDPLDTWPDLVIANDLGNSVSVLLNNQDGSFGEATEYAVGFGPSDVALGDFDGDGALDVVTSNRVVNTVSILFNNGDGTFGEHVEYAVGLNPSSVIAADLDLDGLVDVAAANEGDDTVSVLWNTGDGTFEAADREFDVGVGPVDLIAVDLGGLGEDGLLDLITADGGGGSVSVLYNWGLRNLGFEPDTIVVGAGPSALVAADLDSDGDQDIVVTKGGEDTVSVLLNNGRGFLDVSEIAPIVGPDRQALLAADFDENSYPDLATAAPADIMVNLRLNTTIPAFSPDCNENLAPDECDILPPDGCADPFNCDFDGFMNSALGQASLSLESIDGQTVLRVDGIGSSLTDGVRQIVPSTLEMDTRLTLPNFSQSEKGAILRTDQIGILDGEPDQLFSTMFVENTGTELLITGDWSALDPTGYEIRIFSNGLLVISISGLAQGVVSAFDLPDIFGLKCTIGEGWCSITEPLPCWHIVHPINDECPCDGASTGSDYAMWVFLGGATSLKIPGSPRGAIIGDTIAILPENPSIVPSAQTSIEMLAANTGALTIAAMTTVPPPGSFDLNRDEIPDECQALPLTCATDVNADCNGNGFADACELDGANGEAYGPAVSVQDTQTAFGDSDLGLLDLANGSELDVAYGTIRGDVLYLLLAGNLESNFNKLEIFIDSIDGEGQNRLRGDNPNVEFDGLNRMGDDGSGNGLTFDADFAADYWLSFSGGSDPYELFGNYAELLTDGGGTGRFLGSTSAGGSDDGVLSGGDNPAMIRVTIDNSNTEGVTGGIGMDSGVGVMTGVEVAVPLVAIGSPAGAIRICAFVNGAGHDFLANQVLGPIGGGENLGDPRAVNFDVIPENQFFAVFFGVDCDGNGLVDSCEAANGIQADCNENGSLDVCDLADGTSEDANGNGVPDECEETLCEGDANGDDVVNPLDSGYVLARFGCSVGTGDPSCDAADVNGDSAVNPLDSGYVLARFGPCE